MYLGAYFEGFRILYGDRMISVLEPFQHHKRTQRAKSTARQFLLLHCRAITLTSGPSLKEEKTLYCGADAIWEVFKKQFGGGRLFVALDRAKANMNAMFGVVSQHIVKD